MRLLINDANILIDIIKLELLDKFFSLSFRLLTTDFILEELNPIQKKEIENLINLEEIVLIKTTIVEDYLGINELLANSSGLSFEDCSVWYYSKKMNGILVTGDGKLRKTVTKDGIEVRGIIYLFDQMLEQELISFTEAMEKLELLYQINNRLPKKELEKRQNLWSNSQKVNND